MASSVRTKAPPAGDVHVAARTNDVPLMRELLVANVDVNARDSIGRGPLSYAAENDASDVAKVLIENGADINAIDECGRRPLHDAAEKNVSEAGVDHEAADCIGRRPLHWAAVKDASDVAKVLIEAGADINATDECGRRPLHCAARNSALNIAKVLIEAGADVNAADDCGRRPLHEAAESGDRRLVASLVDNGADLDARDKDGQVALQLAEGRGNIAVMRLLGKNGRLSAHRALSLASSASAGSTDSGVSAAAFDISSVQGDFTREVLDTLSDCPSEEEAATAVPRDAQSEIRHLRIGHIFAYKYRIDSRFLSRRGLSRTTIDVETGQRVNLDFYTDPENLDKSLDLYNRLLESRGVCRLIQKIDARDGLPDCLVVEQGSLKLNGWIKTSAISGQTKAEALGSIADVLKELHGLGIVHADLNPTNITFFPSDRAWKLSNLDSASSAGHKCRPALTSIAYTAPELLEGQNGLSGESECDPSVDMWSFGVIAFEVLTGKKLCETQQLNQESMLEFIRTRNLWRRLNAVQDKSHQRFVKKFLKSDPSSRCTASEARNSSLLWNVSAPGSGSSPWGQEAFSPTQRSPRF